LKFVVDLDTDTCDINNMRRDTKIIKLTVDLSPNSGTMVFARPGTLY